MNPQRGVSQLWTATGDARPRLVEIGIFTDEVMGLLDIHDDIRRFVAALESSRGGLENVPRDRLGESLAHVDLTNREVENENAASSRVTIDLCLHVARAAVAELGEKTSREHRRPMSPRLHHGDPCRPRGGSDLTAIIDRMVGNPECVPVGVLWDARDNKG
jgi:hypothetical protein